jgi:hypothetical protein
MNASVVVKMTNVKTRIDRENRVVVVDFCIETENGRVIARRHVTYGFDQALAEGWLTVEDDTDG